MLRQWVALRRWFRGRMLEIAIALALTAVALAFAVVRVASAESDTIMVGSAWARPAICAGGASAG